jgi:hypothetical protein
MPSEKGLTNLLDSTPPTEFSRFEMGWHFNLKTVTKCSSLFPSGSPRKASEFEFFFESILASLGFKQWRGICCQISIGSARKRRASQMAKQLRERNVMFFPGIFIKTGMPIPMMLPPRAYREVSRTIRDIDYETVDRAVTPKSLRHNYAIRALEKPGLFQPRPYVYICVRCRYSFIVNESRGSILSVDRNGTPLPESENTTASKPSRRDRVLRFGCERGKIIEPYPLRNPIGSPER